ncbi:hypothetical protein KY335_05580 [Candidatus Woesearchaeota archaeon]|nr:hypothetical protein [Candidatus Woesearchaeota archaeon]
MIHKFISQFCDRKFDTVKIRRNYYLADKSLLDIRDKIKKNMNLEPESAGVFLGTEKKDFTPSFALLELLSKHSKKKAFVDDKTEWLFLCGRDIFKESVKKCSAKEGLVLVQNKHDENLGLGKIVDKKDLFIKNISNRGKFLHY